MSDNDSDSNSDAKIKKEVVLYAFNPETQYTCGQCFNRQPNTNICSLFGPNDPISAKTGSCGFYVHEDTEKTNIYSPDLGVITKVQAGYAENKYGFSCKRCEYFLTGENDCTKIDKDSKGLTPGIIHPNACCNHWEPDSKRAKMTTSELLKLNAEEHTEPSMEDFEKVKSNDSSDIEYEED